MKLAGLLTALLVVGAPIAFAQSDDVEEHTFEDEIVPGDYMRPGGEQLVVRRRSDRESLIRIRTEFVAPMLKSVEDI